MSEAREAFHSAIGSRMGALHDMAKDAVGSETHGAENLAGADLRWGQWANWASWTKIA